MNAQHQCRWVEMVKNFVDQKKTDSDIMVLCKRLNSIWEGARMWPITCDRRIFRDTTANLWKVTTGLMFLSLLFTPRFPVSTSTLDAESSAAAALVSIAAMIPNCNKRELRAGWACDDGVTCYHQWCEPTPWHIESHCEIHSCVSCTCYCVGNRCVRVTICQAAHLPCRKPPGT